MVYKLLKSEAKKAGLTGKESRKLSSLSPSSATKLNKVAHSMNLIPNQKQPVKFCLRMHL